MDKEIEELLARLAELEKDGKGLVERIAEFKRTLEGMKKPPE